jgi:hypothetical protein
MARLSDEELNKIIERDMPGHRLVRRKGDEPAGGGDAAASERAVDDVSPDLAELKQKYLGDSGGGADAAADAQGPPAENTDDEIVIVEPKGRTDPLDHGSRPKAVVVSGAERKVIGYQG